MKQEEKNSVTSWWWIRHAPVTSFKGRLYGNTDVPANTQNPEPFRWLAHQVPQKALWVVSHLQRTQQTADAIAEMGCSISKPLVEKSLGEQCFGDWQGLTYEEVSSQKAGKNHPFWIAPAHYTAPNGESFADVMSRVSATIRRLSMEHMGNDIVAVAHGGTIRSALGFALNIPPDNALFFSIDNLSITRIDCFHKTGGEMDWCVIGVNLCSSFSRPYGVVFPPRR